MKSIHNAIDWLKWHIWDIVAGVAIIVGIAVVAMMAAVVYQMGSNAFKNASNEITEGIVVDKEYVSAHRKTEYHYSHTTKSMRPRPKWVSDSFSITIRGEKNGEEVEYTFSVTEEEYSSYAIGDHYSK